MSPPVGGPDETVRPCHAGARPTPVGPGIPDCELAAIGHPFADVGDLVATWALPGAQSTR